MIAKKTQTNQLSHLLLLLPSLARLRRGWQRGHIVQFLTKHIWNMHSGSSARDFTKSL